MAPLIPFIPLIASGIGAGASLYSGYKADKANQAVQQQQKATQDKQLGLFDQANALIPGMQNISQQYGQASQGFLQDRQALDGVMRDYGGLYNQMNRLYGSTPGADGMAGLRGLLGQDNGVGSIVSQMQRAAGVGAGAVSDGGYSARLAGNAQGVLNATDPEVYRNQARLAGNDAMGHLSSQLAARGIASSGASSRLGASTLSRLYADAANRGQQDRLNAYGISNNALGQAGNLALGSSQAQVNANLQAAGMQNSALAQAGNLALNHQGQQAGLWGQLANLGMQQGNFQAGLLGQMGNMLGAQQGNILAGSGLLGNYLQGLQGQYGMQQGIGNMYNNQAGLLGGIYNQQAGQINQNPYGGFGASMGAIGNAAGQYMNWQAKQPTSGVTAGGGWGGVTYPGLGLNPYN